MFFLNKINGKSNRNLKEYVLDSVEDLKEIPKESVGTKVFIIESSETFILNDKKEWKKVIIDSGGSGEKQVQPNWEQNDKTKPDYIKNRPFNDEDCTREEIQNEINFKNWKKEGDFWKWEFNRESSGPPSIQWTFKEDDSYNIQIDNKSYYFERYTQKIEDEYYRDYLFLFQNENVEMLLEGFEQSSNFYYCYVRHIKIKQKEKPFNGWKLEKIGGNKILLKPIDDKYISNNIARAEDIQQANWSQTQSDKKDYIKNKPFHDEDCTFEIKSTMDEKRFQWIETSPNIWQWDINDFPANYLFPDSDLSNNPIVPYRFIINNKRAYDFNTYTKEEEGSSSHNFIYQNDKVNISLISLSSERGIEYYPMAKIYSEEPIKEVQIVKIGGNQTLLKQLDDKYISDNIARVNYVNELLGASSGWKEIAKRVREGTFNSVLGQEFEVKNQVDNSTLTLEVIDEANLNQYGRNILPLECKNLISNNLKESLTLQFDNLEYLYNNDGPDSLLPGTYCFEISGHSTPEENGKFYNFTITKPIPANGKIYVYLPNQSATFLNRSGTSYTDAFSKKKIETFTFLEGKNGSLLGKTDGKTCLNILDRVINGSSNYAQSAIRQWLNSDKPAGEWWVPQTKFDAPPKGLESCNGFLRNLPKDFINNLKTGSIKCNTSNEYEIDSLDGTHFIPGESYILSDKVFILSLSEMFGEKAITYPNDGEGLEIYTRYNKTLKKYDDSDVQHSYWTRTLNDTKTNFFVEMKDQKGYSGRSSTMFSLSPVFLIG